MILSIWLSLLWTFFSGAIAMRTDRMAELRKETVDMFYHGFNNYMHHAFPEDELRPLTCGPLTRDPNNADIYGVNDVLGNYTLTLIDSLSTLAILAGGPDDQDKAAEKALGDFQQGIADFVRLYGDGRQGPTGQGARARGFDLDSKVQVFETVIRGLGGLLSAHLFAIGELPIPRYDAASSQKPGPGSDPLEIVPLTWPNGFQYNGQLLRLALDLGQRLLPAFYSNTGIPYPRVNLRHGIPFYVNSPLHRPLSEDEQSELERDREVTETCSAGAGSLTLEFTVLSRLTGDLRFEEAAKRAFWEVWDRRSQLDLIGNGIDPELGEWMNGHAGIGAGMDSFFEYALKSHILLSGQDIPNSSTSHRQSSTEWLDPNTLHGHIPPKWHSSDAFLEAWHQAHASVKRHLYNDRHQFPYYSNNHLKTGQPFAMWIDSLGAFYPGLLALAGEVDEAVEANLVYTALWTRYSALPERWSVLDNNVVNGIGWWPGRPEFIESTYYIYRATQDPWYLYVGEMVLKDIKWRCHTPCGWSGLEDVRSGVKSDRMESFFLGETAKYLYLLFDQDHPLNRLDAAYVFNTEGHPLILPKRAKPQAAKSRASPGKRATPFYSYYNQASTHSCPVPSPWAPLAGSITAARPDLHAVSRFTGLDLAPNVHGPLEPVEVEDEKHGTVIRYRALSNHTYFPWTLPPNMLPSNGTCAKPPDRIRSWIEFPTTDLLGSLAKNFGQAFTYPPDYSGPLIKNVEGLRLQLELHERPQGESVWRISHLGNTQLGKDEVVHFQAEHVIQQRDEIFQCIRRTSVTEIHALFDGDPLSNITSGEAALLSNASVPLPQSASNSASLLRSILRSITTIISPQPTLSSSNPHTPPTILQWLANTPTGPGSFPLPAIPDVPLIHSDDFADPAVSNFAYTTLFFADTACSSEDLTPEVPRDHQVIVMKRGGCSFSEKLDKIPSFTPSKNSLQLVLVVDEEEDAGAGTRPLLSTEQMTPTGMRRVNGLPMVLVQGMQGDYELLKKARAVGIRRKYRLRSQKRWIENAVVV